MTRTNKTPLIGWDFLKLTPGRPNVAGDITRLFNGGGSVPPASFERLLSRREESAISAALYGREGFANCLDAARNRVDGGKEFALEVRFTRLNKKASSGLWAALDLESLAERANDRHVDRKKLGLAETDCLSAGPGKCLRVMTVTERHGGGMPGSLADYDSVLAKALLNVGEAQITEGAAGSYGYGKAAVAQASRTRTIIAYTCHQPHGSDPVTRRLLGVAYWGMHEVGEHRYNGWALFGNFDGADTTALEDAAADDLAKRLGLAVRDPSKSSDHGTTFMVIEPTFEPDELLGATEIFWWPLLQQTREHDFSVSIHTEDGEILTPQVDSSHPELGEFVTCFKRAEQGRDSGEEIQEEDHVTKIGEAGITSMVRRSPDSPVDRSLVAKMRSPLMVVSYDRVEQTHPAIVGVFVSHDDTNENLRRVEPPEHDKWHRSNVGGLNASPDDVRISRAVVEEINLGLEALREPEPPPIFGVTPFSRYFPAVDAKTARPRPPRPKGATKQRLVRVHLVHDKDGEIVEIDRPSRQVQPDGSLSASAEVKFFLDPDRARRVGKTHLDVTITIGAQVLEDGRRNTGEWWPARVQQRVRGSEAEFELSTQDGSVPARFHGRLHVGQAVHFVIDTESYDSDWTMEMVFDCSPWDIVAPIQKTKELE